VPRQREPLSGEVLRASQRRLVLLARAKFESKSSTSPASPTTSRSRRGDGVLDIGDGTSETAITTNEDVLRVGPVELIIGGGVDGGDVFVGEGEDPLAGVAAARLHLLEQEREGALRVVGLPGDGDA
jgi:hypothetical protein